MAIDSEVGAILFLIGRVLYGGLLAVAGMNHFLQTEEMVSYAELKGTPAAEFGVITTGVLLVLGGVGIVIGLYPVLAAGMLATFFVVTTPQIHNFWAVSPDEKQAEMTQFLKNIELLGAALVFLALGDQPWAYALNVGLWL